MIKIALCNQGDDRSWPQLKLLTVAEESLNPFAYGLFMSYVQISTIIGFIFTEGMMRFFRVFLRQPVHDAYESLLSNFCFAFYLKKSTNSRKKKEI